MAALAAHQIKWPIVSMPEYVVHSAVAGLAVGIVEPWAAAFVDRRLSRRLQFENDVRQSLKGALYLIVRVLKLDWDVAIELSVNAFLVRRPLRRPWEPILYRIARESVAIHTPSHIRWTRGKGVIGKCWERRQEYGLDLEKVHGKLRYCTKEQWRALAPDERIGLSYEEFQKVKHYGAVGAVPILDAKGKFIGCVSVDAPGETFGALWNSDGYVRGLLAQTASTIAVLCKQAR
ncbi:MAG TPA: hypothetical protein VF406_07810 [Thermodesulfobacteriota bacterium]